MIQFEIVGLPSPQGSKTRMPSGAMLDGKSPEARKRHKDWRTTVAQVARDVAEQDDVVAPLDGPLCLAVEFRFPMPASRPKKVRERGRAPKVSAPDLDKLLRALGDGLQAGGLVRDDARFTALVARKVEVADWTGAIVTITPLNPEVL